MKRQTGHNGRDCGNGPPMSRTTAGAEPGRTGWTRHGWTRSAKGSNGRRGRKTEEEFMGPGGCCSAACLYNPLFSPIRMASWHLHQVISSSQTPSSRRSIARLRSYLLLSPFHMFSALLFFPQQVLPQHFIYSFSLSGPIYRLFATPCSPVADTLMLPEPAILL